MSRHGKPRKKKPSAKPKPRPPKPDATQSTAKPHLVKRILRFVVAALTLLVTIGGSIQLLQQPSVETPTLVDPDNPLFAPFEITNESLLPLISVDARCEPQVTRPDGHEEFERVALFALSNRMMFGREKATARCESLIRIRGPFKSASMKVIVSWRPLLGPWRWERTYLFSGIISWGDGRLVRWVPQ